MTQRIYTDVKEYIRDYWNDAVEKYDNFPGHGLRSKEEKAIWLDVLHAVVRSEKLFRVLDVGCGTGFLSLLLAEFGHSVTGLDFSEEMLIKARGKAKEIGLSVEFQLGDVEECPFPTDSFDVVINRHLVWTLPHPEQAVKEWKRILKPGGKLVIIDGKWTQDKIVKKFRWVVGELLSALIELRIPWDWKRKYKPVRDLLPFYGGVSQEEIVSLLGHAGFNNIEVKLLTEIWQVEKKVFPWYYRLSYGGFLRYMVTGVKS